MEIKNDTKNSKFVARVGPVEARIDYKKESDNVYNLIHTIVPKEAQGQGVAQKLVEFALETAKKESAKIIATCPYVKRWFEKHPEEKEILLKR